MFGKRGQFFLVAALVISGILIGLAGIYTQVNAPQEDLSVFDVSSELNYETLQVIDQGVYSDLPQDQINSNIINLTEYYVAKDPTKDFIIVYGDQDEVRVREYHGSDAGTVGVSTGGPAVTETVVQRNVQDNSANVVGENILVTIGDVSLSLNLNIGQQFYAVVTSTSNNQTYVAGGDSKKTKCGGNEPSGNGVAEGSDKYLGSFVGNRNWNYVTPTAVSDSSSLLSCQWTCKANFVKDGNGCRRR